MTPKPKFFDKIDYAEHMYGITDHDIPQKNSYFIKNIRRGFTFPIQQENFYF